MADFAPLPPHCYQPSYSYGGGDVTRHRVCMNGLQHYRKPEELTFLGLLNPEELPKRRCFSVDTV